MKADLKYLSVYFLGYSDQNQSGTLSNHSAQLTICQVRGITGCNHTQSAQISFCSSQAPDWMTEFSSVSYWSKSTGVTHPAVYHPPAYLQQCDEPYTCSVPVCALRCTMDGTPRWSYWGRQNTGILLREKNKCTVVFDFDNKLRQASFLCTWVWWVSFGRVAALTFMRFI